MVIHGLLSVDVDDGVQEFVKDIQFSGVRDDCYRQHEWGVAAAAGTSHEVSPPYATNTRTISTLIRKTTTVGMAI